MLSPMVISGAGVVSAAAPAAAADRDCTTTFRWAKGNQNGKATYVLVPSYGSSTTFCNLSPGDSGGDVWALQDTLKRCYGRNIAVDRVFGDATKGALGYAQRAEGIADDGYNGRETRKSLKWPRRWTADYAYTGTCIRL